MANVKIRDGFYLIKTGDRRRVAAVRNGELTATRSEDAVVMESDFMTNSPFTRAWGMVEASLSEVTSDDEDKILAEQFPNSSFEYLGDWTEA